MRRHPPSSTRPDTIFPYSSRFRSCVATAEYAWLRLMAATKYDGYGDFRAGSHFIESLATWLKQFDPEDRQTAYDFVKHRLVFISSAEMQRAIEAFFPETVTPLFRRLAAEQAGIPPHELWRSEEHTSELQSLMRISYAVFCLKKKNNNSNN